MACVTPGVDRPRPPEQAGHPHAALERRPLAVPQRTGRAAVGLVADPGAVVTREHHQGPLREVEAIDGLDHLPNRPVDLLDDIAVDAGGAPAAEALGPEQRHVGHRVGQVQEERPVAVRLDERHRLFGVAPRDRVLVGGALDHPLVPHDGDVPVVDPRVEHRGPAPGARRHPPVHVVRVGDAEPRVEAVPGRQVLGQVAEMPLADDAGGVTRVPQRLGQGDLPGRQPRAGIGEEDPLPPPEHPAPQVDAPRQQGRPARRAHRGLAVEARPPLPLRRHAVEVGGADGRVPVRPQVAPAEVVGGDDDDVRRPVAAGLAGGLAGEGGGPAARRREQGEAADRGQRGSPAAPGGSPGGPVPAAPAVGRPRFRRACPGGSPAFDHRRIIVRHPGAAGGGARLAPRGGGSRRALRAAYGRGRSARAGGCRAGRAEGFCEPASGCRFAGSAVA